MKYDEQFSSSFEFLICGFVREWRADAFSRHGERPSSMAAGTSFRAGCNDHNSNIGRGWKCDTWDAMCECSSTQNSSVYIVLWHSKDIIKRTAIEAGIWIQSARRAEFIIRQRRWWCADTFINKRKVLIAVGMGESWRTAVDEKVSENISADELD